MQNFDPIHLLHQAVRNADAITRACFKARHGVELTARTLRQVEQAENLNKIRERQNRRAHR